MLALGTLFLLLVYHVHLDMIVFALSYYIVFFHVWLLCLGSPFFSNERQKGADPEGKGEKGRGKMGEKRRGRGEERGVGRIWGGTRRSRGMGNYS